MNLMVTNFNSHAHVERDHSVSRGISDTIISTHTLTWSVTVINNPRYDITYISTHTLTWSVTTAPLQCI